MSAETLWPDFVRRCEACQSCELCQNRRHVVVWRGAITAPLMLIGEGPGAEEDQQGKPFVGASGRLLNYLMVANGFDESDYHVCNIVKCRPPQNRKPLPEEAAACAPLLREQIELVRPKVVLLLGATAWQYFTGEQSPISRARGHFILKDGIYALPTFHPAYILRDNRQRIHLWNDVCQLRAKLEALRLAEPLDFQPQMPTGRATSL